MDEKLVDKEYLLEKLPGKYGWTYTIIPEIRPDPNAPFNWVKVRGTIDSYQIKGYRLMPSGDVMPSGIEPFASVYSNSLSDCTFFALSFMKTIELALR